MHCKLDYIAFSVPTRFLFEAGDLDDEQKAHDVLTAFLGEWWSPIASGHRWERYKTKGFYHTRLFDAEAKISIFIGDVNRHVYVEIGGQALDYIRALGSYENLCEKVATRASRVDLAVDFGTQLPVSQFVDNNYKGRFKAGGNVFSEDGETSYVGSWKGERFARVYRYHDPHPRSKFLRAEVVLRANYAKQALAIRNAEGDVAAVIAGHKPFQWQSELWKPDVATESEIKSHRSDKESASTLRWLNGDVAECIARLHREGLIDAEEWYRAYVATKIAK